MEIVVAELLKEFEGGRISRRQLISGLAAAALAASGASGAAAQTPTGFRTMNLDHIAFQVPEYRRMRDFYADLLGMTVTDDDGRSYCQLQFGDARGVGARDRAFLSVTTPDPAAGQPSSPPSAPRIDHIAFKIDNWETDRVRAELERRGLRPRLQPGGAGDAPNYVSFHVQDPDGFGVQISGIARPGDPLFKRP